MLLNIRGIFAEQILCILCMCNRLLSPRDRHFRRDWEERGEKSQREGANRSSSVSEFEREQERPAPRDRKRVTIHAFTKIYTCCVFYIGSAVLCLSFDVDADDCS